MTQPQDTLDQDVWWTRLMAVLEESDERTAYAATFHRIMQQRAPLGVPVQYERLLLYTQGGKRKKKRLGRKAPKTGKLKLLHR
jgi:hypothetical protein